ncbi:MAG: hypothetical protein ACRDFB_01550, partial [Rhabdochlamydiaceae bacterium]
MSEGHNKYYDMYKGPDMYRVNLHQHPEVDLSLGQGSMHIQLFNTSQEARSVHVPEDSTGFLYTYGGNGSLEIDEDSRYDIQNEDLFYLRPGAEFTVAENSGYALLLTRTVRDERMAELQDKALVTRLSPRTNKEVDWTGSWIAEVSDLTMHAGREGTSSQAENNSPDQTPLHKHLQILEVGFVGEGRGIMMLERDGHTEK